MLARDVMTKDVVTVEPDTSVQAVADTLIKHRISAVPVVDKSGQVVGIVSEGDLIRRLEDREKADSWWLSLFSSKYDDAADFVKARGRHARDVATANVVSVAEDTPVSEIARLLETRQIKRVVVLRDEALVGIVSRGDLLRAIATSAEETPPMGEDDQSLRDAVSAALNEVPGLDTAFVSVTVKNGVAEIWGLADSADEARGARVAAENVPGVTGVKVHLGRVPRWVMAG